MQSWCSCKQYLLKTRERSLPFWSIRRTSSVTSFGAAVREKYPKDAEAISATLPGITKTWLGYSRRLSCMIMPCGALRLETARTNGHEFIVTSRSPVTNVMLLPFCHLDILKPGRQSIQGSLQIAFSFSLLLASHGRRRYLPDTDTSTYIRTLQDIKH